jgi:methylthioribose-1-phosphate isomerase
MKYADIYYRSIWVDKDEQSVNIIDQAKLPHEFMVIRLCSLSDAAHAIRSTLAATRPTAVNLAWALAEMHRAVGLVKPADRAAAAFARAAAICDEDVAICAAIGRNGLPLIEDAAKKKPSGHPVNILTHCNAGWLATVDWGTALAPIYMAHDAGIPVHVWVDETRPRNQGAALTAWELGSHGVPHTVIADNAGGTSCSKAKLIFVLPGRTVSLPTVMSPTRLARI